MTAASVRPRRGALTKRHFLLLGALALAPFLPGERGSTSREADASVAPVSAPATPIDADTPAAVPAPTAPRATIAART